MKVKCSSVTLATSYKTAQHHDPEDHSLHLYTSSLCFYFWWNLFSMPSSMLLMFSLGEELWTSAVDWYCRSRKCNTMQWRTPHHYPHHRSSERREAGDAESSSDTAVMPQRVGSTGTSNGVSLRQPKLSSDMSPALVAQTNWSFVEKLLKVSMPSTVIYEFVSTSYLASFVHLLSFHRSLTTKSKWMCSGVTVLVSLKCGCGMTLLPAFTCCCNDNVNALLFISCSTLASYHLSLVHMLNF
jgi:hypothetical protein